MALRSRAASTDSGGAPWVFRDRFVHLDLKGAPPTVDYLIKLMPLFANMGATGLLIEWEDMLPYEGKLECIRNEECYSRSDVGSILAAAAASKLQVVPLVQTFGHLEFVLKHDRFRSLRETPDNYMDLCPLADGAKGLVTELIAQIAKFHPGCRRIHIGCDEVFTFGSCPQCAAALARPGGHESLFLNHVVHAVSQVVRVHKAQAFIWHDMVDKFSPAALRPLAQAGVQVVVWSYGLRVDTAIPDGMWARLRASGLAIWGASAFKGASEPGASWVPVTRHAANHDSWLEVAREVTRVNGLQLQGIFLTGWSRFNNTCCLCETLPAGVPALAMCLAILANRQWDSRLWSRTCAALGVVGLEPRATPKNLTAIKLATGAFPGAEMFRILGLLEAVRLQFNKVQENRQLFCPPYTHRVNRPMWDQLREQAEAVAVDAGVVADELLRAGRGILLPGGLAELVATKARLLQTQAERIGRELAKLLRSDGDLSLSPASRSSRTPTASPQAAAAGAAATAAGAGVGAGAGAGGAGAGVGGGSGTHGDSTGGGRAVSTPARVVVPAPASPASALSRGSAAPVFSPIVLPRATPVASPPDVAMDP